MKKTPKKNIKALLPLGWELRALLLQRHLESNKNGEEEEESCLSQIMFSKLFEQISKNWLCIAKKEKAYLEEVIGKNGVQGRIDTQESHRDL